MKRERAKSIMKHWKKEIKKTLAAATRQPMSPKTSSGIVKAKMATVTSTASAQANARNPQGFRLN